MRTRDTTVNENNKNRVHGVCSSVVECLVVAQVVVGAEPARYPHHIAICDGLLSHANSIILSWMLVLE